MNFFSKICSHVIQTEEILDTSEIIFKRSLVEILHLQFPKTRYIAFCFTRAPVYHKMIVCVMNTDWNTLTSWPHISIHWKSGHKYFWLFYRKKLKHLYTRVFDFHKMIFFYFLKINYEHLHEVKDWFQLDSLVFENVNYSQILIYCYH